MNARKLVAAAGTLALLAGVAAAGDRPDIGPHPGAGGATGGRLPEMSRALASLAEEGGEDLVEVVVLLTEQGGDAVAREVRAERAAKVEELEREVLELRLSRLPERGALRQAEEQAWVRRWAKSLPPADASRLRELKEELDREGAAITAEISTRLRTRFAPSQEELARHVEALRGVVTGRLSAVNILFAEVPASALGQLADHPLVGALDTDRPGTPDILYQLESLGADAFHGDNPPVDGWPWDVAIIDSGVDDSHPALSSHEFIKKDEGWTEDHGTKVAGCYGSTDDTFRGLAFGLDAFFVAHAGEESVNMTAVDWALSCCIDAPEVINHSFSHGWVQEDDYLPIDAFHDAVVSTYNVVTAQSAGNAGWNTSTCVLSRPGTAHNVLTTANVFDINNVDRGDDYIWESSSNGPTPSGRRKPDIAAPGHFTATTVPGGDFLAFNGTSAAAPKVGAGALLLRDLGVSDSKAIRAILVNTADAWDSNETETITDDVFLDGSHWDMRFGWGYLDLSEAWFNGGDYFVDSVGESPNPGYFDFYSGFMWEGEKSTLVWDKRVGYDGDDYPTTEYDLTNLNLRLYDEEDPSGPEDADFDTDDNVHQVAAFEDGVKVITVYASDLHIDGLSEEPYALATEENFSKMNGPDLSEVTVSGLGTTCGEAFWIAAYVTNAGDLWGHGIEVEVELPPLGWSLVSGDNPAVVGTLADGSTATVLWKVQPPAGAFGWYPFYIRPTSDSYGISQSWWIQQLVEVRPAPANDTCETAEPIPPAPGTWSSNDDSRAACDDYDVAGACTGYDSAGRDVVYSLHLTEQTWVCVTMTPDITFDPVLYVVADCAAPGDCLAGVDTIGYGVAESLCVTLDPAPGGQDFYIVADAYGANTGGEFTLEVSLTQPVIFADGFESGDLSGW